MSALVPSQPLMEAIERSEINYMRDRMLAIQSRPGNPEGIEIRSFGNAVCFYSRTMPWSTFNTVKGLTNHETAYIKPIIDFYRERGRSAQFEIVPSLADTHFHKCLADQGYFQAAFHTSTVIVPQCFGDHPPSHISIQELQEDQFDTYAMIHCKGTGLPESGIAPVSANNKVLYHRGGWKHFIAYVHGAPAAAAVMYISDGIASLTFAATLPEYRGSGLHQHLLKRRIEEAKRHNCKLVVGQCGFLSQSHRNMERVGMKIGYIRTTWTEA